MKKVFAVVSALTVALGLTAAVAAQAKPEAKPPASVAGKWTLSVDPGSGPLQLPMELKAEVILKATKVDGIYDADPMLEPTATRFERISYLQVLEPFRRELTVFSNVSHPGVDGGHANEVSFLTGAPHPGWDDDDLHDLHRITGRDLEVVDTSRLRNG